MIEVKKIWLTESEVWIETTDGVKACEHFADYPKLSDASPEQRANYTFDKIGIHWESLDEDLCFDSFLVSKPQNSLYTFFMQHPELNASAIARRMGISQSLFAQYISGAKKPSPKRYNDIIHTLQELGRELISIDTPA